MTDEQRKAGFVEAYNNLRQYFGYYLKPVGMSDAEGNCHISTLNVVLQPIPGWTPPQVGTPKTEATDTTGFVDPAALGEPVLNGAKVEAE